MFKTKRFSLLLFLSLFKANPSSDGILKGNIALSKKSSSKKIKISQEAPFYSFTSIFRLAYSFLTDNFHSVDPGKLYRCRQLTSRRLSYYIKKYHIKSIINLRGENKSKKWWRKELNTSRHYQVEFYNLPMRATKLTEKALLQRLLFLYRNAPKPILIHCQGGADRTGEAAAIWKLECQKSTKKEALKQLRSRYGHRRKLCPEKSYLISVWEGEEWLNQEYDPKQYHY